MKKLMIIGMMSILLLAGSISGAMAGHHYHGCGYMRNMTDMDSNEDGLITFDEYSAPYMEKHRSAFKMLDTNNDDLIDNEEWDKFLEMHGYGESSKS